MSDSQLWDGKPSVEFVRPPFDGWSDCPTPDCGNKVCLWGGLGLCHPCSVNVAGKDEMDRRYAATRVSEDDKRWSGNQP